MTQMPLPPRLPAARLRLLALRLLGMLFAVVFGTGAALAQSAEDSDAVDPPGRVGSVTLLAGPVTMVDLGTGSREDALLNWPVTGGWRIETGRGGRAEVRIGSTALRLDEETTVDFARLDDQLVQLAVLRGGVSLRLRSREILNEIELLTQRERMTFEDVGRYRIDVDRPAGLTVVTAFFGRVRIGINRSTFVVGNGQRGELAASPMVSFEIAGAVADRFDEWVAARDAREDSIRSAAYVSRETTGVEMLDEYGDWRAVEDYGPVWFPRGVPATWAPYRYGRWVWVSPWGWTWVDEAPWGFAPLHYGRWVVVGGYWGWTPGVLVPRPVYAPALVAWFGTPGFGVTAGAPVGWFPLGPREVYRPAYRHTPRYLRVVNVQHVPNVAAVTIVQTPSYVHRHPDRSTWVPDDRFGGPEPVQRGQRPPPSEWRQYIARPQPPANVPNTKRRQTAEGVARPAPATVSPGVPSTAPAGVPVQTQPVVRPPSPVPRAVEAPRPAETPRAIPAPRAPEAPRAVDAPRALPATPPPAGRPEPSRGASESAAGGRDDRRMAPRAPTPSAQPPSVPYAPPAVRTQPRETAPAPLPSTQPLPAPAAPTVERTRPRDSATMPAPSMQPPTPAYGPPRQREAAPPGVPHGVDTPGPRGRGEAAAPRDGHRQAPRGPSAPATVAPPPAAAPPQSTPPAAGTPGGRDTGRAPPVRATPSPRPDSGEPRGGDRGGSGREAAR
jgi:hypothetical protein